MENRIKALEERVDELERKATKMVTNIELYLDGTKISNSLMDSVKEGIRRSGTRL